MKRLVALAAVMCFAATCSAAWGVKKNSSTTAPATVQDTSKQEKAPAAVTVIKGLVVAINVPQNEVVVKDEKTTYDKVLIVTPDMYKIFKIGDAVEVKTKAGSNSVDNIKVTKAASVEKKTEKAAPKKK